MHLDDFKTLALSRTWMEFSFSIHVAVISSIMLTYDAIFIYPIKLVYYCKPTKTVHTDVTLDVVLC